MFNLIGRYFKNIFNKIFEAQYKKQHEFLDSIKNTFNTHLISKEYSILEGIVKQSKILRSNDRDVIAIFITIPTYRDILKRCVVPNNTVENIININLLLAAPVGNIGEIPIYVSPLMKQAPVFVVGEIKWELHKGD